MNFIFINKNKIIFVLTVIFLFFLVFFKFYLSWSFPDTNWILQKEDKVNIIPGQPVIQKFVAKRDNLTKIRILFGKSYRKDEGEIKLGLYNESCTVEERKTAFKRSSIQEDGYYDFRFSKIKKSKDKIYCLAINFEPRKEIYKELNIFTNDMN